MEDVTLGREMVGEGEEGEEVGEEGELAALFGRPLILTHHAEAMIRQRFRLKTHEEVKQFVSYHLLLSGPGRKRRDGALRWTSEENVQVVTRELSNCVLVITAYPLYLYRDRQKTKKARRQAVTYQERPTQRRSKKYVPAI